MVAVEADRRGMKSPGLRPVFHHREDWSRAHVQLCWLVLLLTKVVGTTDDKWRNNRRELDRLHLVTLATSDGTVKQCSRLTRGQKKILQRRTAAIRPQRARISVSPVLERFLRPSCARPLRKPGQESRS